MYGSHPIGMISHDGSYMVHDIYLESQYIYHMVNNPIGGFPIG